MAEVGDTASTGTTGTGVTVPPDGRGPIVAPASGRPPRQARRLVLVLAGVAALAAAGISLTASGGSSGPPRLAPAFALPTVADPAGRVSLAQFRGSPVVLNFWASWCVPCRKELPAFQAVAAGLEGRVAFVGVNHQDGHGGAGDLLAETGARYPSAYDPTGSVAGAYRLFGMPTTVFISADGHILAQHTGAMSRADLTDTIRKVFGIPTAP